MTNDKAELVDLWEMEEMPDHWSPWVKQSMQKLYEAESINYDFIPDSAPSWVFSLLEEVVKIGMPNIKFKALNQPGEEILGAAIGHFRQTLESSNGLPMQLEKLGSVSEKLDDMLRKKWGTRRYERHIRRNRRIIEDVEQFFDNMGVCFEKKYELLQQCVNDALELSFDEQGLFFEAYAKAIRTELFDADGLSLRQTTSTPLYVWMLIYWRYINRMPSVTVLYERLCWIFGQKQIGELDRVKKMCFRHKIRLRGKGRPKTHK